MDEGAVRQSLARVLSSAGFTSADRLSRCLRYIVEETLAGRQDAIKEYTLGVEVYGRKPDYDPKIDAIVRVEAGRLRAKLKHYYDGPGKDDVVRIDLPRGRYVPVFQNGSSTLPAVPVIARPTRRQRWLVAVVALTLMALSTLAALRLMPSRDPALSVAVEPLTNLSGDSQTGSFAAGLTQQLANSLAEGEGFSVITGGVPTRAVLKGGVERDGERLRVMLKLVRVRDGYQAWSATYVSLPGARMAFEDAVSLVASRTLGAQFAGNPARLNGEVRTSDEGALGLYMKGREAWNTQRRPGVEQSAEYYRKAIARDPRFAKAYEGLSASELFLTDLDPGHATTHLASARQAVQQALALDDRLCDAHARLGNVLLWQDWNFIPGEHELARAVIHQPGRPEVTRWYAMAARLRHHAGDARHELELGALANPCAEILTELAILNYEAGDTAAAWHFERLALEENPLYQPSHLLAGVLHQNAGELDLAAREFSSCISPGAFGRPCLAALGQVRAQTGQTEEARRIARSLPDFTLAAVVYLGLHDNDQALSALETALSRREPDLPLVSTDPRFAPLHGNPRYEALLRHIGL